MVRDSSTLSEIWVQQHAGIAVTVIYSDLHLVQLQVRASNRAFAAEVETYANHDACSSVADQLKDFPVGRDDVRKVEFGANASLTFATVDTLGHSIITVDMQGDVPERNGLTPRATFNILVDPAQIDQFASELALLTADFGSSASLII